MNHRVESQRLRSDSSEEEIPVECRALKLRGQEGMALMTVMLLVTVVLILGAVLSLTARASMDRATENTDSTKALDIAEAGLQTAAKKIIASGFTAGQTGTITGTLENGGYYEVSWAAPTALPWFHITATGYYPNEADSRGKRRVDAQVSALNAWDFQYANAMGGTKQINGNTVVYGPMYVNNGSLELGGHAAIVDGPLMIRDGNLTLGGSASVGTAGHPAPLYLSGVFTGGPSYASPISHTVPVIEFPEIPALDNYRFDNPQSPWLTSEAKPCAVWDTNHTTDDWNASLDFTVKKSKPLSSSLMAGSTRVSWSYNGSTPIIVFDNSGGVKPILFVDGDFKIDSAYYQGIGTIVANKIIVNTSFVPVGSTETNMQGFPETNALGLIAQGSVFYDGGPHDSLAAAVYSGSGQTTFSKQGRLRGNSVVNELNLGVNVPELDGQPGFSLGLPPRMPGGDQRKLSIVGWTELSPQ